MATPAANNKKRRNTGLIALKNGALRVLRFFLPTWGRWKPDSEGAIQLKDDFLAGVHVQNRDKDKLTTFHSYQREDFLYLTQNYRFVRLMQHLGEVIGFDGYIFFALCFVVGFIMGPLPLAIIIPVAVLDAWAALSVERTAMHTHVGALVRLIGIMITDAWLSWKYKRFLKDDAPEPTTDAEKRAVGYFKLKRQAAEMDKLARERAGAADEAKNKPWYKKVLDVLHLPLLFGNATNTALLITVLFLTFFTGYVGVPVAAAAALSTLGGASVLFASAGYNMQFFYGEKYVAPVSKRARIGTSIFGILGGAALGVLTLSLIPQLPISPVGVIVCMAVLGGSFMYVQMRVAESAFSKWLFDFSQKMHFLEEKVFPQEHQRPYKGTFRDRVKLLGLWFADILQPFIARPGYLGDQSAIQKRLGVAELKQIIKATVRGCVTGMMSVGFLLFLGATPSAGFIPFMLIIGSLDALFCYATYRGVFRRTEPTEGENISTGPDGKPTHETYALKFAENSAKQLSSFDSSKNFPETDLDTGGNDLTSSAQITPAASPI